MRSIETGQHYPLALDDLPPGWIATAVGDALECINPGFPSGRHNQDGIGVPHLRPMNVDRQGRIDLSVLKYVAANEGARLKKGDVLFNNTNSAELIGKTAAIERDEDWAFSNHMTRLRPGVGVSSKFMAFQLHFLWMAGYFLHRCTHHVNQASISSGVLAETVPLVVAPTREQGRIVAEIEKQFTRLDAALAALKRAQANLKRYRAAVLKAACEGRLVPTEGELARKEGRSYETGEQLLARILKERRAKWEADHLAKMIAAGKPPKNDDWKKRYKEPIPPHTINQPPLPGGWTWANVDELKLFSIYGPRFSSDDYSASGTVVLRTTDISESGKVDLSSAPRLKLTTNDLAKYRLTAGDLVFTRTGATIGKTAIFDDDVQAIPGAYLIHVRLATKATTAWYIYRFFQSVSGQSRLLAGRLGIGQPNLNAPTIEAIPIPLPPVFEQQRILAAIDAHLTIVEKEMGQVSELCRKADRLRQSILKHAFEGKLVPQDPSDEPASVLLECIRAERNKLAKTYVAGRRGKRTVEGDGR